MLWVPRSAEAPVMRAVSQRRVMPRSSRRGMLWGVSDDPRSSDERHEEFLAEFPPARLSFEGRSYVLDPDSRHAHRGVPVVRAPEEHP